MNRRGQQPEPGIQGEDNLPLCLATSLGGIGMFRWELASDKLYLTKRAREILRVNSDRAATMQQAIAVTLHPGEQERAFVQRDDSRSVAEKVPVGEWQLLDDHDRGRWMTMTMAPAQPGTQATEMIGSLMDVTARHDWERERAVYLSAFEALARVSTPAEAVVSLLESGEVPPEYERVIRAAAARMAGQDPAGHTAGDSPLTARETEVLQMASHGGSSAAIAERLVVSTSTVKTHFEHIYAKLGVSERAGAVGEALRRGLIE